MTKNIPLFLFFLNRGAALLFPVMGPEVEQLLWAVGELWGRQCTGTEGASFHALPFLSGGICEQSWPSFPPSAQYYHGSTMLHIKQLQWPPKCFQNNPNKQPAGWTRLQEEGASPS